jgi:hypothetical protein
MNSLRASESSSAGRDVPAAIGVLETAFLRHPDPPAADRLPVLANLAELHLRYGEEDGPRPPPWRLSTA